FFFFQAEDGIRDRNVTGVQTCALPIWRQWRSVAVCGVQDGVWPAPRRRSGLLGVDELVDLTELVGDGPLPSEAERAVSSSAARRSEERRVGGEGSARWAAGGWTEDRGA